MDRTSWQWRSVNSSSTATEFHRCGSPGERPKGTPETIPLMNKFKHLPLRSQQQSQQAVLKQSDETRCETGLDLCLPLTAQIVAFRVGSKCSKSRTEMKADLLKSSQDGSVENRKPPKGDTCPGSRATVTISFGPV